MNIIITGPKHIGKSTVISAVLRGFKGSVSGFITEFDHRASSTRELRLRSIDASLSRCAVSWQDGKYRVFPTVFDEFASALINCQSDLVVIDELGKFEKDCSELRNAVYEALVSPCTLVASVRLDAPGWIAGLKTRSDIRLITVTEDNRDTLPKEILNAISGYGDNL